MTIDYSDLNQRIKEYADRHYALNLDEAKFKAQIRMERELMEGALIISKYPEKEWEERLNMQSISRYLIPAIKEWIRETFESQI